jgi:hypothetical protein
MNFIFHCIIYFEHPVYVLPIRSFSLNFLWVLYRLNNILIFETSHYFYVFIYFLYIS